MDKIASLHEAILQPVNPDGLLTDEWRDWLNSTVDRARSADDANVELQRQGKRSSSGTFIAGQCVTLVELLQKLKSQRGRCYYSGIPLQPRSTVNWRCSLERLNDSVGHTNANTRLVCLEFNNQKQWTREKFAVFLASCVEHKKIKVPSLLWIRD